MSSTNPILDKPKGILNPKGIIALSLCLVAGISYLEFCGDAQLKTYLETKASEIYGARVEIGSLRTNLRKSTVTIKKIQIPNPYSPMKNLVEIDHLEFNYLRGELLKRKLIIPEMKVTGVHMGTPRDTTGALYLDSDYPTQPQSILDRVDPTFFAGVRSTLDKNPLKQLAPISAGYYLPTRMDPYRHELLAVKDLTKLKSQVETIYSQGSQWLKQIPSRNRLDELKMQFESIEETQSNYSTPDGDRATTNLLTELKQNKETIGSYLKENQEKIDAIKSKANDVGQALQHDLNYIKSRLNLPNIESNDLTYALFGSTFLNDLEKIAYWINTLREKMPVGENTKGIRVVQQPKSNGTSYHFGQVQSLPSLWIKRIVFKSELDPSGTRGKVEGELDGLTLDPLILGTGTTLSLTAEFPKRGIEGLHLDLHIDHTGDIPKEEFSFSLKSLPIENWIINQASDYKLKLAKGKGSVIAEGELNGESLDIQWEFNVEDAEIAASSRYKMVEETLKSLLTPNTEFSIRGRAKGKSGNVAFQMQSELGRKLGIGIADNFKQQFISLDESLKNRILDDLVPLRQEIFEKIGEIETSQFAPMKSTLDTLLALEQKTEKIASNNTKKKPQVLTKRTRKPR